MVLTNRGIAWNRLKNFPRAIADFDQAIRINPEHANALNNRAWIWATCAEARYRDGPRAVELASLACELSDGKVAHHLGTLAAAFAEVGNFARAIEYQEKANQLYQTAEDQDQGKDRLAGYTRGQPFRDPL